MLEKAATIKRFVYLPLGSELKKQSNIEKKQYQGLGKVYEFNKTESDETINKDDKEPALKKYKKFNNLSLKSKYSFLAYFFNNLDKYNNLKSQKEKKTKREKNKFG